LIRTLPRFESKAWQVDEPWGYGRWLELRGVCLRRRVERLHEGREVRISEHVQVVELQIWLVDMAVDLRQGGVFGNQA